MDEKKRNVTVTPINEQITLIDDDGESTCYLVTGTERALLIDSANGPTDVKTLCEGLTDLPVTVVNTHGHCDHVFGNIWFDEAWLAPADWAIHDLHFGFDEIKRVMKATGRHPARLRPLKAGQVFDLGGGLTLECLPVPGHTPGSMVLLDRKHRVLFSGDAINGHIWMQLDESLPIRELKRSVEALTREHGAEFDLLLGGHAKGAEPARHRITGLLRGCEELLAGKRDNEFPYPYFGGVAILHRYGADDGECIVFTEDKLKG